MGNFLLLGAEAIALGAIDSGISGVYAYPGTPSTEIATYIQNFEEANDLNIRSKWSANEKTAYEAALGMSYAGKRAMVCMKHVGLNVAADAFINSAITGINGGFIVVVADDPSMHSSQNEQDTRFYGKFSYLPLLEPSNQQEAYDCVRDAYNLSEEKKLPVIIRITTRLSHSRSSITRSPKVTQNKLLPDNNWKKWILLPANAVSGYQSLLKKQSELIEASEKSKYNFAVKANGDTGIIAFGIAYNYVMEVLNHFNVSMPLLKISQYPIPEKLVKDFYNQHKRIIVAEEGYPIYEEMLKGYFNTDDKISGRLNSTLPRTGELSPDIIAKALKLDYGNIRAKSEIVPARLPELCKGCSHRDVLETIKEVLSGYPEKHVFSDIGCYTLGALPPFSALSTCVDMGASVTMAKGAADAGLYPAVALIGDSTFTHSGITGLLDAVNDNANVTIIISDNSTTAMTGGQDSSGTGKLQNICKAVGVDEKHIRTIIPLKKNLAENVKVLKEEIEYCGVSVIIADRECIHIVKKHK